MRGFRSTLGISSRPFATNILILFAISAMLFSGGCSGLVSGNNSVGNPGTLTISNATVASATPTSVGLDWQTNAAANSQIEYGATTSYGSTTAVDSTMVTSHQLTVSSLQPGTAYHCRVHSADANNNSAVSNDLVCSTPKDTTAPTVSITSPAANATLSGAVNLTATASDNVAVASVQFKVDNANTGTAITVAPYAFALNTTTLSDGNHILTAVATDTSGNATTSAAVAVKVNNTTPGPSITSLNPTSGLVGATVTITGANFGAAQGTSTVTFNGTAATATNWSATSIVTTVPAGATSGNVVVTVGGVASNGVNFTVTVPAPSITSLSPTSGVVGTSVTITGANFGATQGTSTVKFNGIAATPTSWGATNVTVPVPAGATTGNVVVTVGGVASNGVNFTVTSPGPSVTSLNPASGVVGTPVTIAGVNFGATQGTSTVMFGGIAAVPTNWSATSITATVPAGATTGNVVVTVGGVASNGVSFTVTVPSPSISSLNPTSGLVGASVTIAGANFGTTQGTSTVKFNGTAATATSWSAASIITLVPAGATTGNVVVTVGGVASNGVSFTVTVPAPSITSLNPTSGLVGASVTITGTNFGATQGTSTVTFNGTAAAPTSWSATSIVAPVPTGATSGNVIVTVGGLASNGVVFTVSSGSGSPMGPLVQSSVNTRYFVDPAGNAVYLSGSHTWNDFQDTDTNVGSTPGAVDFNAYVNFLKAHNQNVTILWHKDLPEYCGWNVSGSTWRMAPWPWMRPGPGVATDGNPKFDLTQFNQPYFDRLLARTQQLQQNGIYAIVELFDGNQLTSARCSTDGYAFTGANNVNGVDDGYTSGAAGVSSVTMTANNAITNFQDAYLKKMVDTLNNQPNVIWEIAEEQPGASMTWWAPHMMGLVKAYEGGGTFEGTTYTAKAFQHPVGIGSLNFFDQNDTTLYGSIATWVAPTLAASVFPSNVPVNNQGKVAINDSDHSLGYKAFTNSDGSIQDQNLRGYIWENITQGAEGVVFMDPYVIFWQGSPVRNNCLGAVHQVCTGVDTKYDKFRSSMGFAQQYVNAKMDLLKAMPQGSLASTSFCLADNASTGAEYLVYAPSGGTFTVNLSATTRALNVEWFNPATGATTAGAAITGGSTKSFTAPFSGDAVLYIVDAAGHN